MPATPMRKKIRFRLAATEDRISEVQEELLVQAVRVREISRQGITNCREMLLGNSHHLCWLADLDSAQKHCQFLKGKLDQLQQQRTTFLHFLKD